MPIAHQFDVTPTRHVLETHPRSCSQHATFDTKGIAKKDRLGGWLFKVFFLIVCCMNFKNCGKRKIECWTVKMPKVCEVFVHLLCVTQKLKYVEL